MSTAMTIHEAKELLQTNPQIITDVQAHLITLGFDAKGIADIFASLLNESLIKTNSGEVYRDNKVVLETLKLLLATYGTKGVTPTTNIAIFNNTPKPGDNLQY